MYRRRIVVMDDLNIRLPLSILCRAAGVVGAQGGLTSHGAVLAREFNIPALVLTGAKMVLPPGAQAAFSSDGVMTLNTPRRRRRSVTKFRHLKEGRWLLLRPRQHSMMRNSLVEDGIKSIPRVLWGVKLTGGYRQDARGYWYKNHPTPRAIVNRVMTEPRWLERKLQERAKVFQSVDRYLKSLLPPLRRGVSVKRAARFLGRGRIILGNMRPYTNLTQIANDEIELRLSRALSALSQAEVVACFSALTKTSFMEAVRQRRIILRPRIHAFRFPSPSVPLFIPLRQRHKKRVVFPPAIRAWIKQQPVKQQAHINQLATLMAMFSELSELSAYYYTVMMDCVNILLEVVAIFLVKRGQLALKDEIFNMHIDDVQRLLAAEGV